MAAERVTFATTDGVEIVGNLYRGGPDRFAIFLHMRPSTKEGWDVFATKLTGEHGVTSLAIDERGHGESTMGGSLNYETFTDDESRSKIHDVEAAFTFLKSLGAREENTIVIGGSIGANLAIWFLSQHPSMKKAVALSPGLNYRGVTTDDKVSALAPNQRLLLVASDDDQHEAFPSVRTLHDLNPSQTDLFELHGVGHAEKMFDARPELMEEVIKWLSD